MAKLNALIYPADHQDPFFPCVLVVGMCLLVLINLAIIFGVIAQRVVLLRIWSYVNYLVLIVNLHFFLVDLLVRRRYQDCLITSCCILWVSLYVFIVRKYLLVLEEEKKNAIDVPLLVNDFNAAANQ